MRLRIWGTAGAAALAVPAVVVVLLLPGGTSHPHPTPAPVAAPPPAVVTTPPAPSPSPTPSPTPTLDPVAAARPTQFVMSGPKFTIKAHVCAMPNVRPLDPPGEQHHTVCWVKADFGVKPGNPSTGTSYVLGHAWAEDPLEVLNPMSELAMKQVDLSRPSHEHGVPIYPVTNLNGYTITLTTTTGTLTYRVDRVFAVSKARAADVPSVMDEKVPDRIVLITCGVRGGKTLTDVDVNVIAYATLVRAVAA